MVFFITGRTVALKEIACMVLLMQLSTNSPENIPQAGVIGNSHKISMGKLESKQMLVRP